MWSQEDALVGHARTAARRQYEAEEIMLTRLN